MGTKNFSNANDLITFSRASGGTALRKVAYSPELVTNGTFDTDLTGWPSGGSDGASASVVGASARLVGNSYISQAISGLTAGQLHTMTVDIPETNSQGSVRIGTAVNVGDLYDSPTQTSATTLTTTFVPSGTSVFVTLKAEGTIGNTSLYMDFDNVSVKEVLFDQGDLTLFNHPAGIPRIEYDADGNVLGLLVEESRTNLFTYSLPTSDGFTVTRASLVTSTVNAPDGNYAKKLVEDSTAANSHLLSTGAVGMSLNTTYTMSWFAKAAERDFIAINIYSGTTSYWTWFDLSNGTVGTATNSPDTFIEYYGDGWYRCGITVTTAASGSPNTAAYIAPSDGTLSYDGDGTSGIYIWGAQLEAGAFPTSYIPTAGSTATRSADVASIPVADFGYNQSEGSVVVEGTQYESSNSISRFVELYGGGTGSGGYLSLGVYQDSSWIETYNGDVLNLYDVKVSGERQKMASGFDSSGNTFCGDGNILGTPSTSSLVNPSSVSLLYVGVHWAGIQQLNGHIKSIKYFPRKLTNAQLQELTT